MKEFLAWLERNRELLADRDLDNIRDLAIAAGFDRIVVSQWYTRKRFENAI